MDELELRPTRRTVVTAIGLLPLAALAPALLSESQARAAAGQGFGFFDSHQAAVVKAAAARLVPGPQDDPIERLLNSPGATEADVVRYIDTMLSMFDDDPPTLFAGGPWSDRSGGRIDHMAKFVAPSPRQLQAWQQRIADLRTQYVDAVTTLDTAASTGDFTTASTLEKDRILTAQDTVRALIFGHTIEGMYSVPEYGGNAGTVGWKSVSWPGDSQPRGYTAAEVEQGDGLDVLLVSGIVADILGQLPKAARRLAARGWPRG